MPLKGQARIEDSSPERVGPVYRGTDGAKGPTPRRGLRLGSRKEDRLETAAGGLKEEKDLVRVEVGRVPSGELVGVDPSSWEQIDSEVG